MTAGRRRRRWLHLLAATACVWVAAAALAADMVLAPATPIAGPAGAPLVVVTFVDRSVSRALSVAPGDGYGAGNPYQSSPWGKRVAGKLASRHALSLVTQWPIETLGVHCVVYAITDGRSFASVMQELRQDAQVSAVYPMQAFHTLGAAAAAAADPYRPLQHSVTALHLDAAHRFATGRDVTVGIVDTAVEVTHADLIGQIAAHQDLVDSGPTAAPGEAHGTAVAGVIAAHSGNPQGIVGVAPDARLTVLRACWPSAPDALDATCNTLTLAKALDAAIRRRLRVLNLSLTGPRDALLEALLQTASEQGMIIVGAMPVDGSAEDAFPTGFAGVIRVGVSGQSTSATAVTAPGTDVFTTFPHGRYGFISGSSIAAAHVTGVVALLLQVAPTLPASAVSALLLSTAAPTVAAMTVPAGSQALDACALIARAAHGIDCQTPTAATVQQGRATPARHDAFARS